MFTKDEQKVLQNCLYLSQKQQEISAVVSVINFVYAACCCTAAYQEVCTRMRWGSGAHGAAVGSSTALQTGRSRVRLPIVSLEFFIDIILQVALWP